MRRASISANLPEIESIEMLERIEAAYAKRFGAAPFNVSHWDPSEEFQTDLLAHLDVPMFDALISYRFSYQVAETHRVVAKLGGNPGFHSGLVTPSCTTSILCVLNWLRLHPTRKIIIACPAYFSLFQACRRFNVPFCCIYLKRRDGTFALPPADSGIWREPAVLWLTSPVYNAGVYLSSADLAFLNRLLEVGWTIIADECLALPGHELIRKLGRHSNFLSIYSPHKSICINGIKFSIIIFASKHLGFMERWADVWYGGLGWSSSLAILHFVSPNFDSYLQSFQKAIASQRELVDTLCRGTCVEIDTAAMGHFVSCYVPRISSRMGNSRDFLERLVNQTGGSVIPGNRSRFSRDMGFSFRVNLARGGAHFEPALARIIGYVNWYADYDLSATGRDRPRATAA